MSQAVRKIVPSNNPTMRKITFQAPEELIRKAMNSTGQNLTATLRKGLELLSASHIYEELRKCRGKYKLSLNLDESRKDRDLSQYVQRRR